jgi:hypothetical protein
MREATVCQVKSCGDNPGECAKNRLERASKGSKPRYSGPRLKLIYGDYSGVEEFALNELQATVQRYPTYVVRIRHEASRSVRMLTIFRRDNRKRSRIADLRAMGCRKCL